MVIQQDVSFFEELEAAAKRLSMAAPDASTHDLHQLFNNLKTSMRDERVLADGRVEEPKQRAIGTVRS